MRIPSAWTWLAATTALPSVLANGGSITFSMDSVSDRRQDSSGRQNNIINRSPSPQNPDTKLVFDWTSSEDLLVSIKLRAFRYTTDQTAEYIGSENVPLPKETMTITTGGNPFTLPFPAATGGRCQLTGNCPTKRSAVSLAAAENFQNVTLKVSRISATTGTVEIEDFNPLLDLGGLPLFFEANFVDGSQSSQPFTVLKPSDLDPDWTQEFFVDNRPFPSDKIKPSKPTSSPAATDVASSSSSGGALPTGAIAGIAVGAAVIVLAFLGFLVWFFLRRRRQARDDDTFEAYANGRTRTDELMAEKEANAGVDVSPHSPYSDDGGQRDSSSLHNAGTGAGMATAAVAAHHHKKDLSQSTQDVPRSFTPYSDGHEAIARSPSTHAASIIPASSRGVPDSPIPGRATPHGVQTPYAHLVEEGMTEDEIRRLEDEERALDAAIEQSAVRKP
ncbi:hypothetical protein QBC34DRAFT_90278 [Podospora aff. communis PSN243]|uniref:Mid2 domain-containing protein n=1 Tax=Podospora aff. communis PSN243 TaxID=3040156 RepID=A0AAV9GMG6_9PEZI|nr:hypothetical protein QBC34DRAFT_90278 [Podospora aff. communis PSN243]